MPLDWRQLDRSTKSTQLKFILTEFTAGLTFATVARQGGKGEAAARKRARAAYENALRFLDRVTMTQEQSQEIHAAKQKLKQSLEELGERF